MNLPKIPEHTSPFLWGAVAGAIAIVSYGFIWGGWVSGATAEAQANTRATEAVVASLVPICIAQFQSNPKRQASLVALKATKEWEQSDFVAQNGWATMPGSTAEPDRQVATACAAALNKQAGS